MIRSTNVSTVSAFVKYPYLANLKEFISNYYGVSLSLISLLDIDDYVNAVKRRIESYLKGRTYKVSVREDVEVVSFYLGLAVTNLADPWARSKYIDSEAKRARSYLLAERDEIVEKVAKRLGLKIEYLGSELNRCGKAVTLGIDVKSGRAIIECFQYRIPIPQYVKASEKLAQDPKWKLVNRYVSDGYVYLMKADATRLIEEYIKAYLIELASSDELSLPTSNEVVSNLINYVLNLVKEIRGFTSRESREKLKEMYGVIRDDLFPPCIKKLRDLLIRGEHLSHHQRFALATFLLNIGAEVDYVLELFKHSPDFNEKIARYQIEHLAGLRGSRKKYKAYSCDKMRSLGMCISNCNVRSPVTYYWRELRRIFREAGRKSSHNQESRNPPEHRT